MSIDSSLFKQSLDSCFLKLTLFNIIPIIVIALALPCSFIRNDLMIYISIFLLFLFLTYIALYIFRDNCEKHHKNREKSNLNFHNRHSETILHIVIRIFPFFTLPAIMIIFIMPMIHNCPPEITELKPLEGNCSNNLCIEYEGNRMVWYAFASDIEKDPIFYKFLKRGPLDTNFVDVSGNYSQINAWSWMLNRSDIGNNKILAVVIDRKHQKENGFDDIAQCDCVIRPINPIPEATSHSESKRYPNNWSYTYEPVPLKEDFLTKVISAYFGKNPPKRNDLPPIHVSNQSTSEPVLEPLKPVQPAPEPVRGPTPQQMAGNIVNRIKNDFSSADPKKMAENIIGQVKGFSFDFIINRMIQSY